MNVVLQQPASAPESSADIDNPVPVVILKLIRPSGPGIMKALGERGIAVYGVDSDPHPVSVYEPQCAGTFRWELERASPEDTVTFLLNLARNIGDRPVLYPTNEQMTKFLSLHSFSLLSGFRFPVCRAGLIYTLCNRRHLYTLGGAMGVTMPAACFPQNSGDLHRMLNQIRYPVHLVKTDRTFFEQDFRLKLMVNDRNEILRAYEGFQGFPQLMIQEVIQEGKRWHYVGYFDGGSASLFALTVYRGSTDEGSTGDLTTWNPAVAEISERFIRKIGFVGPITIEIVFDKRDGQYKVVDVAPHMGTPFSLITGKSGMDLVRMQYLDMTNSDPDPLFRGGGGGTPHILPGSTTRGSEPQALSWGER